MRTDTKTKVCYRELNDKGELKKYITSETAWNKILKEVADANAAAIAKDPNAAQSAPPDLFSSGTFGYSYAEVVDEAVSLAGGSGSGTYENIDVFLGVFNYGAGLRQDNEANDILQSDNFEAWEGVKDVSYSVAEKQERAKMTNEERALRELNKGSTKISMDELRAALQLIQAQSAGASATA